MKKNIGSIDRILRIVIGLGIIAAGVMYSSWWGAIGAILVVTALIGWCPPYALLGLNTNKPKQV